MQSTQHSHFATAAALVVAALAAGYGPRAAAQCATCPTPMAVTAYQPVAAAPVVAAPASTPWYPGKLIGQWLSRPSTTYAVAPASYTAGYGSCDPCATTTLRPVSYTYYPRRLLSPAYTTVNYAAVTTACYADSCGSCTSYSPCTTCSPCSSCDSCSTGSCSSCGISSYAAAPSDCASCSMAPTPAGGTTYADPGYTSPSNGGNITPQPRLEQKPDTSAEPAVGEDGEANEAGYEGPGFPATRSERDPVARRQFGGQVRTAVYRNSIEPQLVSDSVPPSAASSRHVTVQWKAVPRDR